MKSAVLSVERAVDRKLKAYTQKLPLPKVDVPEGISGDWRVSRFEVDDKGARQHNFHEALRVFRDGTLRVVIPGTYTRLTCLGAIVMSDTPAEMDDHLQPVERASGHVLVNGLGLGMVAGACLVKPEVEKVTVVEISRDVIKLVGPHYKAKYGDRLEIVQEDAFKYKPPAGVRYSVVWHDIWNSICGDNREEMKKLRRKYNAKCGWQGCWCEVETIRARR